MDVSARNKYQSEDLDELFQAILMLEDIDECYSFFIDICTVRELQSISQRLQVAKLLKIRKTYNEIEEETGASTATISRVNRALVYGEEGYELVLQDLISKDLEQNKDNED